MLLAPQECEIILLRGGEKTLKVTQRTLTPTGAFLMRAFVKESLFFHFALRIREKVVWMTLGHGDDL